MKRILSIVVIAFFTLFIVSCFPSVGPLKFKVNVKQTLTVGEEVTVTVTDENGKLFNNPTITLTIKSGQDVILVNGLKLTGLKAGTAKVTVKVAVNSKNASIDVDLTVEQAETQVGLPKPNTGFYMRDADMIQDVDGSRYLLYVTNKDSGEEEQVLAIKKGTLTDKGYVYGDEKVIIEASETGWDKYIGSASIVKGNFKLNNNDYNYLIAYQGTLSDNEKAFNIGLAVATDPLGDWVKVDNQPVLEYDAEVYGESYVGFYAPSLVNMDKNSIIRVFFTWGDAFGHFTYFVDFDAGNLDTIDLSGYAMVPNRGNLSSGEDVTMVPNADLAYDAINNKFYMIKDYSPVPNQRPAVATRIELAIIDENELYSAKLGVGWTSLALFDTFDTPNTMYERLYAGTIVSDMYGHMLSLDNIEIVYNVSELQADNPDYIFSQFFLTFNYIA